MASLDILVLGGSGFLSGTIARRALERGDRVWAITRGQRPLLPGVTALISDRNESERLGQLVAEAGVEWDLVIDCIGYEPLHARQDLELFPGRAGHLVFVSTDFVYDPARRRFPQSEEHGHYLSDGYGGKKRQCELVFENAGASELAWTIVRPCHIYGPGSQLGCLPLHSRDSELMARLQRGETLRLVGGGHFLQQPILAQDLADLILSVNGNPQSAGEIYCAAGPEIIESRTYYQIIADLLDVPLTVEEVSVQTHLATNPGAAPFACHRIYDLAKLQRSGLAVPGTPMRQGLSQHVESLLI